MKTYGFVIFFVAFLTLFVGGAWLYKLYEDSRALPDLSPKKLDVAENFSEKKQALTFENDKILLPIRQKVLKVDFVDQNFSPPKSNILIKNVSEELLSCVRGVFSDEKISISYHRRAQNSLDVILNPHEKLSRAQQLLAYFEIDYELF